MEAMLLGIYCFFVWLIFIKFKLLPWTTPWKVTVAIIPVVGLTAMILLLNIGAPSSADVRVIKYVVPIVSQVKGRVIEVPADNNKPMKKGDVLFRIDPTPYQIEVRSIEAQIVSDQARTRADRAKVSEADARLANAVAGGKQVNERLNAATGQVGLLEASLELARKRLSQNRELAAAGAGSKFDLEQSETKVNELNAQLAAARANQQAVRDELAGQVGGDLASVAAAKAQVATAQAQLGASEAQLEATRARLDNARWELQQTVTRAPADGLAVNVQLRQGAFVTGMPLNEVMTFVDYEYQSTPSTPRTSCIRSSRATKPRSRSRPTRATSSRPTWTRSCGRRAWDNSMPRETCRARQSRRRRGGSPSSWSSATRTRTCSWRRARTATRRFTRSGSCSFTSSARSSSGWGPIRTTWF